MKGQAVKKAGEAAQKVNEETGQHSSTGGTDERQEDDPEHHVKESRTDVSDPEKLLETLEIQRDLDIVSQSVFKRFGPSPRYSEWQDLRQETAIKFLLWRSEYRHEATYKTILNRIATNLCIDEVRRQKALPRAHEEVDLETIDIESLRDRPTRDTELRILLSECRNQLSDIERVVLDEYHIEGRSLTEVATRHGFSTTTAVNVNGRLLKKLRQLVPRP